MKKNFRHNLVTTPITVNPRKLCTTLFFIAFTISILSFVATILKRVLGRDDLFSNGLIFLFDTTLEGNVATYFSSLNLLICSAICYIVWKKNSSRSIYVTNVWRLLCFIFLFLSIDETCRIHEQFSKLFAFRRTEGGYLRYAWIIPYGIFALSCGLYFLRFVRTLPGRSMKIFVVSGITYVVASIGFEPIEGHLVYLYGRDNLPERMLANIEEFFEMSAIIYFIFGSLDYLRLQNVNASLQPGTMYNKKTLSEPSS